MEPRVTGNHGTPSARRRRDQEAAEQRAFLLPVHDRPAKIEDGQIVGRLHDQVPGPVVQSLPPRNWFPA